MNDKNKTKPNSTSTIWIIFGAIFGMGAIAMIIALLPYGDILLIIKGVGLLFLLFVAFSVYFIYSKNKIVIKDSKEINKTKKIIEEAYNHQEETRKTNNIDKLLKEYTPDTKMWKEHNELLQAKRKGIIAIRELGDSIGKSAYQEKKLNPYIMGGIGEGIGGLGVGLASFADTVAQNYETDVRNSINEAKVKQMGNEFSKKADKIEEEIANEKEKYSLEEMGYKLSEDNNESELFKRISLSKIKISQDVNTKIISYSFHIKYEEENTKINVLDGFLYCHLKSRNGKLNDKLLLRIPYGGFVSSHYGGKDYSFAGKYIMKDSLDNFNDNSLLIEDQIQIKIEKIKLWKYVRNNAKTN